MSKLNNLLMFDNFRQHETKTVSGDNSSWQYYSVTLPDTDISSLQADTMTEI